MRPLKEVIAELRKKHGNKTQVAAKLGISSQLLGQYESGRHEPKIDFFDKWEEVYGEDIRAIQKETNVSRETKNGTSVQKASDIKGKPLGGDPEVYRTIVEGNTEYVLILRSVMADAQIISNRQMDATVNNMEAMARKMDNDSKIMQILVTKFVDTVERVMLPQSVQAQKGEHQS